MITDPYVRLCDANVHQGHAHTCDDPVSCGIASIGQDNPEAEVDALLTTIDQVRDLCASSKTKLAQAIMAVIVP